MGNLNNFKVLKTLFFFVCFAFASSTLRAEEVKIRSHLFSVGRLAFSYSLDGSTDIYVADFSTGEVQPLITGPAVDEAPDWSPDGRQLVFHSDRDGNREIYVSNADGSGVRRLTNNKARDENPRWMPDGQAIVFDSDAFGAKSNLVIMNADGTMPRVLAKSTHGNSAPVPSPRGDEIAFISDDIDWPSSDLVLLDLKTGKVKQLSRTRVSVTQAAWDPSGSRLAFTWGQRDPAFQFPEKIWILKKGEHYPERMNQVGEGAPAGGYAERDPHWSERSALLFFAGESREGGKYEIFLYDLEKRREFQLTEGPGSARHPAWTPLPQPPEFPRPSKKPNVTPRLSLP